MIPAVMHTPLAVGITLLLSFTSGIAVWGDERPHPARAPRPEVVRPVVEPRATVVLELTNTLVALGDDAQRSRAHVAATAGPAVMMRAAAAPSALGAQRGLPWTSMNESQRAIAAWTLRAAGVDVAALDSEALGEVSFAFAGDVAETGDVYARLHGATFVVEVARLAGRGELASREFGGDADAPWLRDRFVP